MPACQFRTVRSASATYVVLQFHEFRLRLSDDAITAGDVKAPAALREPLSPALSPAYREEGARLLHSTEQHRHQALLEVKPVLGLREDERLRAFQHAFADFQPAVGRQAVQDH